jgi:hypothetical protein
VPGYRCLIAAILSVGRKLRVIDMTKAPDDHVTPEGGARNDADWQ